MEPVTIDPGIEASLIRIWRLVTQLQTWQVRRPIPTWETDGEPLGILEEDWDYENPDWWGPDHDRQMAFVCETIKTYVIDCLTIGAPALDLSALLGIPAEPDSDTEARVRELAHDAFRHVQRDSLVLEGHDAHQYARMTRRVALIIQLVELLPGNSEDPVQQLDQTRTTIAFCEQNAREAGEW